MWHHFADLSNRLKTGCVLRALASLYRQLSSSANLKGRTSPRSADIPSLHEALGAEVTHATPAMLVVRLAKIWEIICKFIFLNYDGLNRAPNSGNHQVQDHKIEVQPRARPGSPTATFNQGPPP